MLEVWSQGPNSDVLDRINLLAEERRGLLASPEYRRFHAPRIQRLQQVDEELEYLWLRRRAEIGARARALHPHSDDLVIDPSDHA